MLFSVTSIIQIMTVAIYDNLVYSKIIVYFRIFYFTVGKHSLRLRVSTFSNKKLIKKQLLSIHMDVRRISGTSGQYHFCYKLALQKIKTRNHFNVWHQELRQCNEFCLVSSHTFAEAGPLNTLVLRSSL